jgi:hypothetical protein
MVWCGLVYKVMPMERLLNCVDVIVAVRPVLELGRCTLLTRKP